MSTCDFYRDLAPFHSFPHEVFAPEVYRALPHDWVLIIADIAGSTRAVGAGRYAEVNHVGAACIVAVNNALEGFAVPAVFRGDGATLAVPPEARDAALATPKTRSSAWSIDQALACLIDAGTSMCRTQAGEKRRFSPAS